MQWNLSIDCGSGPLTGQPAGRKVPQLLRKRATTKKGRKQARKTPLAAADSPGSEDTAIHFNCRSAFKITQPISQAAGKCGPKSRGSSGGGGVRRRHAYLGQQTCLLDGQLGAIFPARARPLLTYFSWAAQVTKNHCSVNTTYFLCPVFVAHNNVNWVIKNQCYKNFNARNPKLWHFSANLKVSKKCDGSWLKPLILC